MSREIRINAQGAGDWIMQRAGGAFRADTDHSLAAYRDGAILGGFVLASYMGGAIAVHDAGDTRDWCTRDLLWMVFHYAFVQLGCAKIVAPVVSDNERALGINLRAGFALEAVLHDAVAPGRHLMLLTMTMADCRWLRIIPRQYFPGGLVRGLLTDG